MTSLASWIGIDSRGQSSIYIVSDSRISWSENAVWNYGRKVFASRATPEIFGYCGDVLFPSMFLSQVVDSISIGKFDDIIDPRARAEKLLRCARASREGFPKIGVEDSFSILYCSRSGVGMTSYFRAPRIISNLQGRRGHEKAAEEAAGRRILSQLLTRSSELWEFLRGIHAIIAI